jgi:hypothetical protein
MDIKECPPPLVTGVVIWRKKFIEALDRSIEGEEAKTQNAFEQQPFRKFCQRLSARIYSPMH